MDCHIFKREATVTVTTKSSPEGLFCLTCNARSEEECQDTERKVKCNENEICAAEVRKRGGKTIGITLGCKQSQACKTNQSMNFHGQFEHQYQCQHNITEAAQSQQPSVCRQCCYQTNCFTGFGLSARGHVVTWEEFNKDAWSADFRYHLNAFLTPHLNNRRNDRKNFLESDLEK